MKQDILQDLTDWHILRGLKIDVPVARCRYVNEPPEFKVGLKIHYQWSL